jgi:16S rRNA (guanine(1405)-N(7))-methyltransferase
MDHAGVIESLKSSRKYRYLCDDTLRRIAKWAIERDSKDPVKLAKRKLDQIYGAYIGDWDPHEMFELLDSLGESPSSGKLRTVCERILESHRSSAERLPILDDLYNSIFKITGSPRNIVDIACGFHPFSIPWMGLGKSTKYIAIDIDTRQVELLNRFFRVAGINGTAMCCDVMVRAPEGHADLVFMLKTVPNFEQQEKGFARTLLESLDAKFIVVSFPLRSLGGRRKGMEENYERVFESLVQGRSWRVTPVKYPREIFYVVEKE